MTHHSKVTDECLIPLIIIQKENYRICLPAGHAQNYQCFILMCIHMVLLKKYSSHLMQVNTIK